MVAGKVPLGLGFTIRVVGKGRKHYERRPYWMWGEDGTVCALLS